ncbi:unnamed protein product, partial [Rotaria sp. Silwood2]
MHAIDNETNNLDEKQRENLEVHSIADIMIEILKQISLNLLIFQENL